MPEPQKPKQPVTPAKPTPGSTGDLMAGLSALGSYTPTVQPAKEKKVAEAQKLATFVEAIPTPKSEEQIRQERVAEFNRMVEQGFSSDNLFGVVAEPGNSSITILDKTVTSGSELSSVLQDKKYRDAFYVTNGELSCTMIQRSCDTLLGVPFNVASYSLLTHMVAQVCGLKAKEFNWVGLDVHLYKNHFEQVKEQCSRDPRKFPTVELVKPEGDTLIEQLENYKLNENIILHDYDPHPAIKAEMAI